MTKFDANISFNVLFEKKTKNMILKIQRSFLNHKV